MRREPESLSPAREHGSHTLKVYTGTVVGCFGNDVFVELGVRMQGVIARDHFEVFPSREDFFLLEREGPQPVFLTAEGELEHVAD